MATDGTAFRRTDRTDAPHYLARYTERLRQTDGQSAEAVKDDNDLPLYLRRFRARGLSQTSPAPLEVNGERFTTEFARTTKDKEIVAPPERRAQEDFATEIRIIRHGITQGYSTDAGLTPMGGWQAHQRGHNLSKSTQPGQQVRIVCADTSRARQTADQIHRGLLDGLRQWGREAEVSAPEPVPELRNFQVWTPDGIRDVTSAFRQYQALMEKLERMAVGDRPRWLVEIDRFYRNQLGGADPIAMWLTIPLMYFEPPQSCVRRFWRGFHRLMAETVPDVPERHPTACQRIIAATHSGPIRAFATWAHGYDPGEPYNTEEVVVRIRRGGGTALVAYRNRVTEVNVPPPDEMPVWGN
jgi:broad specificity phosphatase PhoE